MSVAAAFDEAGAVSAFMSTLPFTRRSCAVSFWISLGPMDSVLETDPMGLLLETLSSMLLLDEWVSDDWGLPFPADSRSISHIGWCWLMFKSRIGWWSSVIWFLCRPEPWPVILHCCRNFSVCKVFNVLRSWTMVISSWKMVAWSGCWGNRILLKTILSLFCIRWSSSALRRPGRSESGTVEN